MRDEILRRQETCDHCACFVTITYIDKVLQCPICHKPPLSDKFEPSRGFNGMFQKKPKRQWIAPIRPPESKPIDKRYT